jgi:hypothetical protein
MVCVFGILCLRTTCLVATRDLSLRNLLWSSMHCVAPTHIAWLCKELGSALDWSFLQVLDMCAAPGSKTFQMLEMIHSGSTPATGLVVANDADSKRCNLLAHQTKRMCSPSMLVSNHDGQVCCLPSHLTTGTITAQRSAPYPHMALQVTVQSSIKCQLIV